MARHDPKEVLRLRLDGKLNDLEAIDALNAIKDDMQWKERVRINKTLQVL